jgi:type I restriction enzyme S subunit
VVSEISSNEDFVKLPAVPQGWTWTNINDLCQLIGGGTPARDNPDFFGGVIVWLTPTEIPKNKIVTISDSKEKITEFGLHKSSARIIPKGSVLLTSRASIGYVAIAGCDVTTNQGFASFVCEGAVYNEYLAYWLFSKKNALEEQATGTTFKEISKTKLRELVIPLPPVPEQHRIVTKIEELLTQLDAGVASLIKVQAQLKRYRQAVLKAAFEGRLTQEWREEQTGELTAASILLEQIKKARKSGKNGNFQDFLIADPHDTLVVPGGWLCTPFGNITDLKNGINFQSENKGEIGVLTIDVLNMYGNSSFVNLDKLYRVNISLKDNYVLKNDDILFVRSSVKREGVGWVSLFREISEPVTFCGFIIRSRLIIEDVSSKFLVYLLRSNSFRAKIIQSSSQVTITNINQTSLRKLLIPIPSLTEQQVIVSEIERLFSIADEVEKTIETSLKHAETFRHSILKRAFEGKLVPQDSTDEPASVLLERIKSEKVYHMAEGKKGKNIQSPTPKRKIKHAK